MRQHPAALDVGKQLRESARGQAHSKSFARRLRFGVRQSPAALDGEAQRQRKELERWGCPCPQRTNPLSACLVLRVKVVFTRDRVAEVWQRVKPVRILAFVGPQDRAMFVKVLERWPSG